jgi:hypothetical protein
VIAGATRLPLWTKWPEPRWLTEEDLDKAYGFRGLNPNREFGQNWPTFRKLSDAERDEGHSLMDKFADEHDAKQLAHVGKLERVAKALGRRLARGEVLLCDAEQRLDRLIHQLDPEAVVPVAIVRADLALEIARRAFDAGCRAERKASQC